MKQLFLSIQIMVAQGLVTTVENVMIFFNKNPIKVKVE
jgi:hypothetical protein